MTMAGEGGDFATHHMQNLHQYPSHPPSTEPEWKLHAFWEISLARQSPNLPTQLPLLSYKEFYDPLEIKKVSL